MGRDIGSDEGKWIGPMLSIDMEIDVEDYVVLEDEQLHFFYVDLNDSYDQELSGNYWPHGTGCWNPLEIDGDPMGELSCWIFRAGCDWLGYENCRLRIKDDINNWTRSGNLSLPGGSMIWIEITDPPDDYEIPEDNQEPVTFNAELHSTTGNSDNQNCIKWSIQVDDDEHWYGPFEDPPYNNWSHIGSTISPDKQNWTGTEFEIELYNDCEMRVRASLDICPQFVIIPEDSITVHLEGWRYVQSTDMEIIAIIVDNEHNVIPESAEQPPSKFLITAETQNDGAPVISRPDGECEIDYVVRLSGENGAGISGACVEKSIVTQVSSPTSPESETTGQPIDVTLFLVDRESQRQTNLVNLFNTWGIPCASNVLFYARGSDMKYEEDTELLKVHDDETVGSSGSDSPEVQPKLFISDIDECQDYAIAWSHDSKSQFYNKFVDYMYYGDYPGNKRGTYGLEYNPMLDKVFDYRSDVLKGGLEIVQFELAEEIVYTHTQSRGNALFCPVHGYVEELKPLPDLGDLDLDEQVREWYRWQIEDNQCMAIGPYRKGSCLTNVITPDDFLAESDFYFEVRWLISTACAQLSDPSIEYWKSAATNGLFDSICGFRSYTERTGFNQDSHTQFWREFSDEFTSKPTGNNNLWKDGIITSDDFATISWMEINCLHARVGNKAIDNFPFYFAGSLNSIKFYYLETISRNKWHSFITKSTSNEVYICSK